MAENCLLTNHLKSIFVDYNIFVNTWYIGTTRFEY